MYSSRKVGVIMNYWSREEEDVVITAAIAGDELAFDSLFQRYLPLVNKWFRELNFKGRLLERDDWHQECRMVLMTTLKRYRGRTVGEFATYYRLNVRNRGFDLRRRQQAQKRLHEEASESIEAQSADSHVCNLSSIEPDGLTRLELQDRLVYLCDQFSEFEQQVWWGLSIGLTIEHIAVHFQCSYTKVRNAANRCHGKAVTVLLASGAN